MPTVWKTVRDVTGWMLATSIGIGVSWLGVRAVLDAAVPDRFLALPAAEQGQPAGHPTAGPASPTAPGAARTSRATPSLPGRRFASPAAPASVSAPPSTVDGWTALGDGQYLRSFHLVGGDAVVRAGHGSVRLVSATPRPGYAMAVLTGGPERVIVDFATVLRVSVLDASWRDDGPAAEVTELP